MSFVKHRGAAAFSESASLPKIEKSACHLSYRPTGNILRRRCDLLEREHLARLLSLPGARRDLRERQQPSSPAMWSLRPALVLPLGSRTFECFTKGMSTVRSRGGCYLPYTRLLSLWQETRHRYSNAAIIPDCYHPDKRGLLADMKIVGETLRLVKMISRWTP